MNRRFFLGALGGLAVAPVCLAGPALPPPSGVVNGRFVSGIGRWRFAQFGDSTFAVLGDYIKNATPMELGGAGSMYIVQGFICIAAGNPGTWREVRVLTGK